MSMFKYSKSMFHFSECIVVRSLSLMFGPGTGIGGLNPLTTQKITPISDSTGDQWTLQPYFLLNIL